MPRISTGDTGAAVADVQQRLRVLGLQPRDTEGTYGRSTAEAVRQFQRRRHLAAHGAVDDETWSALIEAGYALGDRLLYMTRPWLRGDDVRELQRALSRLGFDAGVTDGIHGHDTDAALRDFQHNAGLVVDGIAGAETLRMLASLRRRHQHATTFEVLSMVDHQRGLGSLTGRRIAVDAAATNGQHVVDAAAGTRAIDVVTDVARRLVGQLTARGAVATLLAGTGDDRTARPISRRAALANRLAVDAVVSVSCAHVATAAAEGVTGHHFGDGEVISHGGRRLATLCVEEVTARTGALDCDVHASATTLLRESRAPAVVIEIGFVSNPAEAARLAEPEYRGTVATGLTAAVQRWVEGHGQR